MRWVAFAVAVCLVCLRPFLLRAENDDPPAIRNFPIPTIEALGEEIFRRDTLAWRATDELLKKEPDAGKTLAGWLTDPDPKSSRVYFLQKSQDRVTLAYVVTLPREQKPEVWDQRGIELPKPLALRYAARNSAIQALKDRFYDRRYNFEVLDDPEKPGFLVYALASMQDEDELMIGGHFRVSLAPDGTTVTQVDALSRSLLILSRKGQGVPKGGELTGHFMTHIVSPTPVETHVFVSLQEKTPLWVSTGEKEVWRVEKGKIAKVDASLKPDASKSSSPVSPKP